MSVSWEHPDALRTEQVGLLLLDRQDHLDGVAPPDRVDPDDREHEGAGLARGACYHTVLGQRQSARQSSLPGMEDERRRPTDALDLAGVGLSDARAGQGVLDGPV